MGLNKEVSFSIAKLLKEKNVKIHTDDVLFYRDEVNNIKEHQIKNRDVLYNYTGFGNFIPDENEYQTYKISELVMWLYEKHGIWISVECDCYGQLWFSKLSVASEKNWDNIDLRHEIISAVKKFPNEHNTPTEAYEAAILYCLEKLI
jgi:hypothetical protein